MSKELTRAIEICEDISTAIENLGLAQEDFEGASELDAEERDEARESALSEAVGALDDLLADAAKLPELKEAIANAI